MASRRTIFLVSFLTLAAVPALAQSLGERKMHADQEAQLASKAQLTNKACGFILKTQIDWPSFKSEEVLQKSVVSWCSAGLDAMEDLCSESLGKQAVSEKVKSLTCTGGSEVSAKMADGNLTYAFPFSSASNQNKLLIRSYLEKAL
jgi:hypothetical protein